MTETRSKNFKKIHLYIRPRANAVATDQVRTYVGCLGSMAAGAAIPLVAHGLCCSANRLHAQALGRLCALPWQWTNPSDNIQPKPFADLHLGANADCSPAQNAAPTFYLAQSYRDSGEREKALTNYLKRAELGYWDEEVYVSLFKAGNMMAALDRPFEEVIATYERADAERCRRPRPRPYTMPRITAAARAKTPNAWNSPRRGIDLTAAERALRSALGLRLRHSRRIRHQRLLGCPIPPIRSTHV